MNDGVEGLWASPEEIGLTCWLTERNVWCEEGRKYGEAEASRVSRRLRTRSVLCRAVGITLCREQREDGRGGCKRVQLDDRRRLLLVVEEEEEEGCEIGMGENGVLQVVDCNAGRDGIVVEKGGPSVD